MKKILFAVALLAVAGTANAQDKVVRKARDLKNEIQDLVAMPEKKEKDQQELDTKLAQCFEMIEPTLTSPETKKELANAWDIKAQLHVYTFSPLLDKVIKKEPTDIDKLSENIYAALDAMEECYKVTQELGLKDDKDPYTMPNQFNVVKFRPYIAYMGQMFFTEGQSTKDPAKFQKAVKAFRRWMNYPKDYTILGENAAGLAADEQTPQIAYFTCLSAYFAKDYKTFGEFIGKAHEYTQEKSQVNQLHLASLIEQGDTAAWLKTGREIVAADPEENDGIAQNILAYYFNHNNYDEAMSVADEILAADEQSKIGNYAKGLVLMNSKKYEEAIPFFEKATESDPNFSDAYYNAGVCWSNYGYDLNESLSGKKMTEAQNKAEIAKVKAAYAKAEPYFLKVQELEPENHAKWAGRLATVYYILENKVKQNEMEKLLE
jgi:tetratricopeptide (TPR) repeat protein